MSKLLCLDLGTTFGYAISDVVSESFVSGFHCLEPKKKMKLDKKDRVKARFLSNGTRMLNFYNWLEEKHKEHVFTECVFEEVWRHTSIVDAHAYGSYLGIVTMFCAKYNIAYSGVNTLTIKKTITGSGKAKKEDVINKLHEMDIQVKDHNEADAIALLYHKLQNNF